MSVHNVIWKTTLSNRILEKVQLTLWAGASLLAGGELCLEAKLLMYAYPKQPERKLQKFLIKQRQLRCKGAWHPGLKAYLHMNSWQDILISILMGEMKS